MMRDDPAHRFAWATLLNTNLRRPDSGALFGYLHRYRQAPAGRIREFERARAAYELLVHWLHQRPGLITDYRFSDERTSAISIEVRKDLVWHFDDDGRPMGPDDERADEIGRILAQAIGTYLTEDR